MNHSSIQNNKYINWIIKKYAEIQKELQTREPYRLVKLQDETSDKKFQVYITGTGKTITMTPEEILSDDQMLERFSKKDIRTIVYLACANINKPKYTIIKQRVSEKFNQIIFSLKKKNTNELLEKSANEISADKELLTELNQIDAHRIGYTYGSENILLEEHAKAQLKTQTT